MYDGNPLSHDGRKWVQELRGMAHAFWREQDGLTARVGGVVECTLDLDDAIQLYIVRTAIFCLSRRSFVSHFFTGLSYPAPGDPHESPFVSAAYGFLVLWFQKGVGTKLLPSLITGTRE